MSPSVPRLASVVASMILLSAGGAMVAAQSPAPPTDLVIKNATVMTASHVCAIILGEPVSIPP